MLPAYRQIKFDDLVELLPNPSFKIIDVRSQSEYKEDCILGATNYPVLTDKERTEVGTLYKSECFEARQLGARLISQNLASILLEIENSHIKHSQNKLDYLIYCWRGGMRSKSLFTIMDMIGYRVSVLEGGYKSYRRYVNLFFQNFQKDFFTIYGLSGSGKSELIQKLQSNFLPSLNLEEFANHKGSILGGEENLQPSQKQFESILFFNILKSKSSPFFIVEGESRKIGKLYLPDSIYHSMNTGKKIWVELPIEIRAKRLAEEYNQPIEILIRKLNIIKKFFKGDVFQSIIQKLEKEERLEASYLLLENYYDKLYSSYSEAGKKSREYSAVFIEKDFDTLCQKVVGYFKDLDITTKNTI